MININDIINKTSIYIISNSFFNKLDRFYISIDIAHKTSIRFNKFKITNKIFFSAFYIQLEYFNIIYYKQLYEMIIIIKTKVFYNL